MPQHRAEEPDFHPRLSEASELLPLISDHIVAASSRSPLGTDLDLCPIVEDGLFGYEILPHGDTDTYLIIGRNVLGEPALRRTSYKVPAPDALQLIAVDGRLLSRQERAARYRIDSRDSSLPDWLALAEAACTQLNDLFPPTIGENLVTAPSRKHRYLEEAVCVAHYHLAAWDPSIAFFGFPNEAEMGFSLVDADGHRGALIFQRPNTWNLRWAASAHVVEESWSIKDVASLTATEHGQLPPRDRRMHRRRGFHDRAALPSFDRRRARGRRTMDLCG